MDSMLKLGFNKSSGINQTKKSVNFYSKYMISTNALVWRIKPWLLWLYPQ